MSIADKIISLTKQLLPQGRAFKVPVGGELEKLNTGIAQSQETAWNDAVSILDSAIPDNANFSALDASQWEKRLGLITNTAVPLVDREMAILRKMNHPGDIPARQAWIYLQGQLQAAGFNVWVFENRFSDGMGGYYTKTPSQFSPGTPDDFTEHSDDVEHSDDLEHGGNDTEKVVNNVSNELDAGFDIGSNYVNTFFIGGQVPGDYADVDANREVEFRELIKKLKPTHSVGYLLINFV